MVFESHESSMRSHRSHKALNVSHCALISCNSNVGIPTLLFLSKIDEYDPDTLLDDVTKVFHSSKIHAIVEVRY